MTACFVTECGFVRARARAPVHVRVSVCLHAAQTTPRKYMFAYKTSYTENSNKSNTIRVDTGLLEMSNRIQFWSTPSTSRT